MPANLDPTEFWFTLSALVFGAALTALMAWLERRPRKDFSTRLFPTTPFLFIGVAIALLALVHLLNLEGIHTGRQ